MLVMKRFDGAGERLYAIRGNGHQARTIDEVETRLVAEVRAEFAANGWVPQPRGASE